MLKGNFASLCSSNEPMNPSTNKSNACGWHTY